MLEVKDVSVSYGKSRVVNHVTFRLGKEEKLVVLGRNGVGARVIIRPS